MRSFCQVNENSSNTWPDNDESPMSSPTCSLQRRSISICRASKANVLKNPKASHNLIFDQPASEPLLRSRPLKDPANALQGVSLPETIECHLFQDSHSSNSFRVRSYSAPATKTSPRLSYVAEPRKLTGGQAFSSTVNRGNADKLMCSSAGKLGDFLNS